MGFGGPGWLNRAVWVKQTSKGSVGGFSVGEVRLVLWVWGMRGEEHLVGGRVMGLVGVYLWGLTVCHNGKCDKVNG